MKNSPLFKIFIGVFIVAVAGTLFFVFSGEEEQKPLPKPAQNKTDKQEPAQSTKVIGSSVEGRDIKAHIFGDGSRHIMFVGGIHGGYEWNSTLLSYKFIDYLKENPELVPSNVAVSVVPTANPDGLYEITGKEGRFTPKDVSEKDAKHAGRLNSNDVDLNRNFDCKWKPESTWRSQPVDAGDKAFSEPEAQAIRDFVLENKPEAVIFWHSQSNAVYASECKNGVISETLDIMNTYADAAGYPAVESFDAYEINGDAEGWLASINIPALTVELKTHKSVEWEKNLKGIKALFDYYRNK